MRRKAAWEAANYRSVRSFGFCASVLRMRLIPKRAQTAINGIDTAVAISGEMAGNRDSRPWPILHELRTVGDRRDRQAFDGFLQAKLHLRAVIHLRQQFLVLAFEFNVDTAQQLAVARDAAGVPPGVAPSQRRCSSPA